MTEREIFFSVYVVNTELNPCRFLDDEFHASRFFVRDVGVMNSMR